MNEIIISTKPRQSLINIFTKWRHKEIAWSITSALFLLLISLGVNYLAGTYATEVASGSVRDIILDNIPTFDVDGIFVYGIVLFFVLVAGLLFWKPRNAPFVIKNLSLFIVIRSFFVILTHIGPIPQAAVIPVGSIANLFTFTGDLFFSAHTGLPFLIALIFWQNKYLRILFLVYSLFMGVIVLLGHLHYSIDVFSAFFITYGIYQISLQLFKKDFSYLKV